MSTRIAVMIDTASARIATLRKDDACELRTIESGVERVVKSTGHVSNLPPHGHGGAQSAEVRKLEARRRRALDEYYDLVLREIHKADEVVILGHQTAREELVRLIENRSSNTRVRAVEGADKLTDGEFLARARELFGTPPGRMIPT
jgi:hypothetical protein